jgi:hypothetical protein
MSFKHIRILILLALLFLSTSCNIDSSYNYKEHHIKQHKEHIELIISMTSFINKSFTSTKKFLKAQEGDENLKKESIMAQWRVTISFIERLHYMTNVYRNDYINNNLTSSSIIGVNNANASLLTIILPIQTEFKVEVREAKYEKALKRITIIESEINKFLKSLLENAKQYQKQISK